MNKKTKDVISYYDCEPKGTCVKREEYLRGCVKREQEYWRECVKKEQEYLYEKKSSCPCPICTESINTSQNNYENHHDITRNQFLEPYYFIEGNRMEIPCVTKGEYQGACIEKRYEANQCYNDRCIEYPEEQRYDTNRYYNDRNNDIENQKFINLEQDGVIRNHFTEQRNLFDKEQLKIDIEELNKDNLNRKEIVEENNDEDKLPNYKGDYKGLMEIKKIISKGNNKKKWRKLTQELFDQIVDFEKNNPDIKQCEIEKIFLVNRSTYWRWKKKTSPT
jgi:hypothetical protein